MAENGIKDICHTLCWCAKVNNKNMNYHNKNK